MARLPQIHGDSGQWGQILNDFLTASHDPDGSLKPLAVSTAITNGSIQKSQLSSAVQASLDNADAAIVGTVPDADSTTKGKLQLAGDLTGSAASPTIAAGAVTTTKLTDGSVTEVKLDSNLQSKLNSPVPADGSVTSAKIADGTIANTDISNTAAIAQTKLSLSITNTEIATNAAISQSKIANLTTDLASKASSSHTHAAADIASGTIASARLGSGTASSSTYLRGDGTWASVSAGSPQNVFVSNTAPSGVSGNYMWIQTGLGAGGTDMTFWVEDGQ